MSVGTVSNETSSQATESVREKQSEWNGREVAVNAGAKSEVTDSVSFYFFSISKLNCGMMIGIVASALGAGGACDDKRIIDAVQSSILFSGIAVMVVIKVSQLIHKYLPLAFNAITN